MSTPATAEALTQALIQSGHLPPGTTAPRDPPASRPWYLGLVLGFAGWLAGLFGLTFIWSLFQPDGATTLLYMSAVLIAGAIILYRLGTHGAFLDQLALALSIAGQVAFAVSISDVSHSEIVISLFVTILQLALAGVMPNPLARVLAAFFACCAWALTMRFTLIGDDWFEHSGPPIGPGESLFAWLLSWAPVVLFAGWLIAREATWMATRFRHVLRPILTGLLLGLSLGTVCSDPVGALAMSSGAGAEERWLSLWPLLDMASALIVMLLAFRIRNHALVGVGVVAAVIHCGRLYFLLGMSLITKSAIMVGVGVLLLAGAWLLRRQMTQLEAENA